MDEIEQLGLRTPGALVVDAVPAALAATLRTGDILAFAGTKALATLADLAAAVDAAQGKDIDLVYYRDCLPETVAVALVPTMIPASLSTTPARPSPDSAPEPTTRTAAATPATTAMTAPTPLRDPAPTRPVADEIRELDRLDAAERGETPDVRALIATRDNPNGTDMVFGRTALMWAIRTSDPTAFTRLLAAGADVSARDLDGMTPLMHAFDVETAPTNLTVLQALLAKGADPKAEDTHGRSVLYFAIQRGSFMGVMALLDSGVDANRPPAPGYPPPIAFASALGHLDIVRALLAKGGDVNGTDRHGRTPLMLAADNGELAVARLLTDMGASVNAADDRGRTALSIATEPRNDPPIPFLLRKQEGRTLVAELLRRLGAR
jgi:ankyrin repeat protein